MWRFSFIANVKASGRFHQIVVAFIENLSFELTHFDFILFTFRYPSVQTIMEKIILMPL
jgi:hypothetical protein